MNAMIKKYVWVMLSVVVWLGMATMLFVVYHERGHEQIARLYGCEQSEIDWLSLDGDSVQRCAGGIPVEYRAAHAAAQARHETVGYHVLPVLIVAVLMFLVGVWFWAAMIKE